MKLAKLALSCSLILSLVGCASIAGNNSRAVSVKSIPAGAEIYVDNQQYGVTPAIITLPSYIYGGKSVTLKKPGYHDQTMMVNAAFQPIAILDIFFFPLPLVVDVATGNIVKIDPASLNLETRLHHA